MNVLQDGNLCTVTLLQHGSSHFWEDGGVENSNNYSVAECTLGRNKRGELSEGNVFLMGGVWRACHGTG